MFCWLLDCATDPTSGVLIGNKTDLAARRRVQPEDGEAMARKLGLEYFEMSAVGYAIAVEMMSCKDSHCASPLYFEIIGCIHADHACRKPATGLNSPSSHSENRSQQHMTTALWPSKQRIKDETNNCIKIQVIFRTVC